MAFVLVDCSFVFYLESQFVLALSPSPYSKANIFVVLGLFQVTATTVAILASSLNNCFINKDFITVFLKLKLCDCLE